MARYSDTTTLSISDIKHFADSLRSVADMLTSACEVAEKGGSETVECTHYKSGLEAVDKLSRFSGAVHLAIAQSKLSQAIEKIPAADSSIKAAGEKAAKRVRRKQ